jgi:hypothetical protein
MSVGIGFLTYTYGFLTISYGFFPSLNVKFLVVLYSRTNLFSIINIIYKVLMLFTI